jgi:hypothetical protein
MDSLFDDPAFVTALDKLDFLPDAPKPGEFGYRRTLTEWAAEEGLLLLPPDDSSPELEGEPRQRALDVLTLVGLIFVGAGAAAFVFQERVALIFAML